MKSLRSVTLVAIDTIDANRASRVLTYCARLFDFGGAVLFTDSPPSVAHEHEVRKVPKLDFAGVQRWELSELRQAFQTDFCLYVQHDGWILNPHLWTDDFLKWDYIGAPWPRSWCRIRVGNSGFSLRSRAFCEVSAAIADSYADEGYDVFVCRVMHDEFLDRGIKYAPLATAGAFSWEHDCDDVVVGPNASFGFHGWVNHRKAKHYTPTLDHFA
jgi:hypothetical protein